MIAVVAAPDTTEPSSSRGGAAVEVVAPPASPWTPPSEVTNEILSWLGITSYVALAISILAVMVFGAMLIVDRDRSEPVVSAGVTMSALRIALGVMVISSAVSLATLFA